MVTLKMKYIYMRWHIWMYRHLYFNIDTSYFYLLNHRIKTILCLNNGKNKGNYSSVNTFILIIIYKSHPQGFRFSNRSSSITFDRKCWRRFYLKSILRLHPWMYCLCNSTFWSTNYNTNITSSPATIDGIGFWNCWFQDGIFMKIMVVFSITRIFNPSFIEMHAFL